MSETKEKGSLLEGWKWVKLGEVCKIVGGGTPSRENLEFFGGSVLWLTPTEIDRVAVKYVTNSREKITQLGLNKSSAKILPIDTVLLTSRATIGNVAIAAKELTTNQGFASFICSDQVYNKYLAYWLKAIKKTLLDKAKGTTFKEISKSEIQNLDFVFPPIIQQQAIVSKIEELFSELDKSIETLRLAQQQLKTYRQAVLKWAFEGKLTEEWRKENKTDSGQEVLQKIDIERTQKLSALALNGNKESSRILSKIKKYKFKNIARIDIPKEWCLSSFLNACYLVVDCHNKTAPYQDNDIYLVRTSNIKNGKLILDEKIKFVSEKTYVFWSKRCPPEAGDILFTREAPMGEAAIIPNGIKVCMGQRIMLLRTFPELLSTKYLHYAMMDATFLHRMNENAIGTGVKHLRVGDVEELILPICSTKEQEQIVSEIESRLSVADKMEESIAQSLLKADALRQSILKKAFEGSY